MDANGKPIDVGPVEGSGGLPNPIAMAWDKGSNLVQHGQLSTPGNPAGQAVNVQAGTPNGLRQDANTGYYLDPDSHDVYELGADGKYYPVQDLGVRAQVAKNIATADYYSGLAKDYNGAITSNMAAQRSLADAYRTTISDPNAPSVAREQLNQALRASDATQLSQAAGASGANAYIARRNAAQNIASLNAKAGGEAAALRAGEVATAQKGLGDTLNSLGSEATDIYKANTGLGYNYSGLASDEELGAVSSDTTRRSQNLDRAKAVAAGASGVTTPTPPGAT
jgi:hypothetical protein